MISSRRSINVKPGKAVSRIVESLWWVGRGAWGGLPALTVGDCNIYLIRGQEFDVLVDAGVGLSLAALERRIRQAGGQPARVREIWVTHSHYDHLGGAAGWMSRHRGTRCRMSAVGAAFLRRRDLRLVGCAMNPEREFRPPPRLMPLRPDDLLRCPPFEFRVVALPGHTPDCIGFRGRMGGLDVLFTGDAIIGDQGKAKGVVGWLDGLWLSDARQYERTLSAVLSNPPDLILPGHGAPTLGPAARRSVRNCLARVRRLLAIPDLHTMLPVVPGG